MERLINIKRKCEIMNVLLNETITYWNFIKNIFKFPLVTISSVLVVINSYFKDDEKSIKFINIALNGTNIVLMSLYNNLSITEKLENYRLKSNEYIELLHDIEDNISRTLSDNDIINNFQEKFDNITKNVIIEGIPEYIKKKVHKKYPTYSYPIILGEISPSRQSPNNSEAEVINNV